MMFNLPAPLDSDNTQKMLNAVNTALHTIVHGNAKTVYFEGTYNKIYNLTLHGHGGRVQKLLKAAVWSASYTTNTRAKWSTIMFKDVAMYHQRTFVVSHHLPTLDELMDKAIERRKARAIAVIARFAAAWIERYYKAEFDENAKPLLIGKGARRAVEACGNLFEFEEPQTKRQRV